MIPEIVKRWNAKNHLLEQYFRTTPQSQYYYYDKIVAKIFELVINDDTDYDWIFNISKMTVIDDGDYQGTKVFIIPRDVYQPSLYDYLVTHDEYGSCSGCDTLLGISCYSNGLPDDEQVKGYMNVALHLVQKLKFLTDKNEDI